MLVEVLVAALIGNGSWFGGPHDPEDSGHTASGGTTHEPGIAVYNHKTLGGYWRVKAPNGKVAILRQTDIGPAPWTKRTVDVTYSALPQLGYNEGNFPTDHQFRTEYLGKNAPSNPLQGLRGASKASVGTVSGEHASTVKTLNQPGYEAALQHAAGIRGVASLFSGNKPGDAVLRGALEKAGAEPTEQQFTGHRIVRTPEGSLAVPNPARAPAGQQAALAPVVQRANQIAEKHLPYLWGGGHQGKVIDASRATPLDCSGAVSAALGINPKVSGEFESWGVPGKGKGMTIYANGKHVLMEINGRFWGTSGTNPGGGAGWIKPGAINPAYLHGFVARHAGGE